MWQRSLRRFRAIPALLLALALLSGCTAADTGKEPSATVKETGL